MNYKRLGKMMNDLSIKKNKSKEEEELLLELLSLKDIINNLGFSLSLSSGVCEKCGRKL